MGWLLVKHLRSPQCSTAPAERGDNRHRDLFRAMTGPSPAGRSWTLVCFVLSACGSLADHPSSALKPVPATPAGLAALFKRECMRQADSAWVRDRSAHLRSACDPSDNDCLQNADGFVEWKVPTVDHSSVRVSMSWGNLTTNLGYGPPSGPWNCSVAVEQGAGEQLRGALPELGLDDAHAIKAPNDVVAVDEHTAWHAAGTANRIEFYHYVSAERYDQSLPVNTLTDAAHAELSAYQADRASYPWVLSLIVEASPRPHDPAARGPA